MKEILLFILKKSNQKLNKSKGHIKDLKISLKIVDLAYQRDKEIKKLTKLKIKVLKKFLN